MVIIADDFDATKGYKRIAFREDRDLLDTELNELQEIAIHEHTALMDRLFAPGSIVAGLGATVPSGPPPQSLVLETLLTAALMFVITAVATDTRAVGELASLAIGFTVAANALWAGPISGASMNPARNAAPLPLFCGSVTTVISGSAASAAAVPSDDPSSTAMTG
jgi:hypothetical protein